MCHSLASGQLQSATLPGSAAEGCRKSVVRGTGDLWQEPNTKHTFLFLDGVLPGLLHNRQMGPWDMRKDRPPDRTWLAGQMGVTCLAQVYQQTMNLLSLPRSQAHGDLPCPAEGDTVPDRSLCLQNPGSALPVEAEDPAGLCGKASDQDR